MMSRFPVTCSVFNNPHDSFTLLVMFTDRPSRKALTQLIESGQLHFLVRPTEVDAYPDES